MSLMEMLLLFLLISLRRFRRNVAQFSKWRSVGT